MKLVAVILGRAALLRPLEELDPFGRVPPTAFVKGLVDRYSFARYPQKVEDLDPTKGVVFSDGLLGQTLIARLTLYAVGIEIDTRSSTEEAEAVLEDLLSWGKETFGIVYERRPTEIRFFASQLSFSSDVPSLDIINPILSKVATKLSRALSDQIHQVISYEVTGISIGIDSQRTGHNIMPFKLERRAGHSFAEGIYFASAQLRTRDHIELLKEIEAALKPRTTARRSVS